MDNIYKHSSLQNCGMSTQQIYQNARSFFQRNRLTLGVRYSEAENGVKYKARVPKKDGWEGDRRTGLAGYNLYNTRNLAGADRKN